MNYHLSSENPWWKEIQNPMASQNSSLNQENDKSEDKLEREAMFEKPLTPSDVGKLNRLVIPKQHAERYFPIGGNEAVENVMLLSFEDELGKSWRFRYSYWNSSQSYVLTKGWSRFVKEKRLESGDTIVFERFKNDGDRFFIGWRRRLKTDAVVAQPAVTAGMWTPDLYSGYPYPPLPYQPHCLHAGGGATSAGVKNETSSGNSKTVRLFGVNLECQIDDEPMSGGSTQEEPHYHHNPTDQPRVSDHQNHMHDINFTERSITYTRHHQG